MPDYDVIDEGMMSYCLKSVNALCTDQKFFLLFF